jgi:hypothetical protein
MMKDGKIHSMVKEKRFYNIYRLQALMNSLVDWSDTN